MRWIAIMQCLVLTLLPGRVSGQEKPVKPARIFVHTRGTGPSMVDSWVDDGITKLYVSDNKRLYTLGNPVAKYQDLVPPVLDPDWKGILKLRNGFWWFLRFERGTRIEDQASDLFRYDEVAKRWALKSKMKFRAANFEFVNEDKIVAFGVSLRQEGKQFLAAVLSSDESARYLDEVPFHDFADSFWEKCLTAVSSSDVFVYFPLPGNLYSLKLDGNSLVTYKTPWPVITKESIKSKIDESPGVDCVISTLDHPGLEHSYFIPFLGSQMLFVYKMLDQEQEKIVEMARGFRPVIEGVAAILLTPYVPNAVQEWPTPSRIQLDKWYPDPLTGLLVSIDKIRPAEKPRSDRMPD